MLIKTVAIFFLALLLTGCKSPDGVSFTEQMNCITDLQSRTIAQLYSEVDGGKELIRNSAGYGVFSNINFNFLFFGSAGSGYGVVTDTSTGKNVYMRMYTGGLGIGTGFKDFREVIVFHDRQAMKAFIENGKLFGGYTDAAAKYKSKGGSYDSSVSLNHSVSIYEFTNYGINLQAVLTGSKYWKDEDLNSPRLAYINTTYRGLP